MSRWARSWQKRACRWTGTSPAVGLSQRTSWLVPQRSGPPIANDVGLIPRRELSQWRTRDSRRAGFIYRKASFLVDLPGEAIDAVPRFLRYRASPSAARPRAQLGGII